MEWMRTWATIEQCAIIKMGSVYNKEHKTYHLHYQTETKIVQGKTRFFEIHLKISLGDYLKIGFLGIKCKNENF